ncbi:hypothetical protein CLU92_5349 [Janthinobacterium sp. 61]|uniref:hypothetical protein n=1 Tax=Janthinobacterium sp. 61 TaxID=2035209 RepID=UPI000CC21A6D|nr:hypothetical protein [Janthinobacterium sp. 61]PKV47877.1 hypothetical protein CLU92_5349 [Janthinobacterium sp. 61]
MHARFNLDPGSRNWARYIPTGKIIHEANKIVVETDLKIFEDASGYLNAEEIIANWFPTIKANVFLSHSHNDEDVVIGLAGWLKEEFGLKSFIDSTVWGYSDKLLKLIDDVYCPSLTGETYNYRKRNRSTSHVHMMLSTALMDMIDQCECIIFVNTPSSFKPTDYINRRGKTESPWIYSEIAMTRMLRQRSPKAHRHQFSLDSVTASLEHLNEGKELLVNYPADLLHLTPLSINDLDEWSKKENNKKNYASSLDTLYQMKKQHGQ